MAARPYTNRYSSAVGVWVGRVVGVVQEVIEAGGIGYGRGRRRVRGVEG